MGDGMTRRVRTGQPDVRPQKVNSIEDFDARGEAIRDVRYSLHRICFRCVRSLFFNFIINISKLTFNAKLFFLFSVSTCSRSCKRTYIPFYFSLTFDFLFFFVFIFFFFFPYRC